MTPTHRANVEHCRVLALLASCADSCTEALLLAHGFAVELLRGDARGRDGGVRQELAAGIGWSLINANQAAPLHSITSSARASSVDGMSTPSALAIGICGARTAAAGSCQAPNTSLVPVYDRITFFGNSALRIS